MSSVAVDLQRVVAFVAEPIAPSVPALGFWKTSGNDLECWEYDATGFYVQTLATVALSWTPAGSFPTQGENLAWRMCFVGTGADPSNALLVMADEVADVLAVWDIASKTLSTSTLIVQASPTTVDPPILCGNVGAGNAYVMHREVASGNDFVYVHRVDKGGATLIATIGPTTNTLRPVGFTKSGQSGFEIGDAGMVFEVTANDQHEIALPGGGVSVRGSFATSGYERCSHCIARTSVFATCGFHYADPAAGFPHSTASRLKNAGYNGAGTFIAFANQASAGAIPVDAAETNQVSVNQNGKAIAQYEFNRDAVPSGRLKYLNWTDGAHASLSNAAPTLTIRPSDYVSPGSPGTDAQMPHFMQAFGVDPFP